MDFAIFPTIVLLRGLTPGAVLRLSLCLIKSPVVCNGFSIFVLDDLDSFEEYREDIVQNVSQCGFCLMFF